MQVKTADDAGDTFASVATLASQINSAATLLKQWGTPPHPPTCNSPADGKRALTLAGSGDDDDGDSTPNGTTDDDPWHGLPSMIFGKSPVDWLYDQADPTKITELGHMCDWVRNQLLLTNVLEFSYLKYGYDPQLTTISPKSAEQPVTNEKAEQVLDIMKHVCDALDQVKNSMMVRVNP